MLKKLQIQNYALIKELTFQPNSRLNTITGETGAGKSIMLGALGLILGKRADTKSLFDDNQKCIIEGVFDIDNYHLESLFEENDLDYQKETIIRREITPAGKSRAFINDTPTTLDVLKDIGNQLIDIHSQHDTQFLKKKDIQLTLIDAFSESFGLLKDYQSTFKAYQKSNKALLDLKASAINSKSELDYNTHLLNELVALTPVEGEEVDIEKEMKLIDNIEVIKTNLFSAQNALNNEDSGSEKGLYEASSHLKEIELLSDNYAQLSERLQNIQHELADIVSEIESENENIEFDQARSEEVKGRYDQLQALLKKHFCSTAKELIDIQSTLKDKVSSTNNLDEKIESLELDTKKLLLKVNDLGQKLSQKRTECFSKLSYEIELIISQLGMPDAVFKITRSEIAPTNTGIDEIKFHFSANKGRTPIELKSAASGGEMSRLMFAIKGIMADKVALPTIIFDEIDTGISGEVAMQMGGLMTKTSKRHQIITITHLPQIAAQGESHFFVFKQDNTTQTESSIRELNQAEREQEIAEMIGGKTPSQTALDSARELLGY